MLIICLSARMGAIVNCERNVTHQSRFYVTHSFLVEYIVIEWRERDTIVACVSNGRITALSSELRAARIMNATSIACTVHK